MARGRHYAVALVNFGLPDVDGWVFLKDLTAISPAIGPVIIIKSKASLAERLRAWYGGARACLDKPPHPGKLQDLLHSVA